MRKIVIAALVLSLAVVAILVVASGVLDSGFGANDGGLLSSLLGTLDKGKVTGTVLGLDGMPAPGVTVIFSDTAVELHIGKKLIYYSKRFIRLPSNHQDQ